MEFVRKSNVKQIVDDMIKQEAPGKKKYKKREKYIRQAYNEWLNDSLTGCFSNIRFRQLLTFEIFFTNTNFTEILKSEMTRQDSFNIVTVECMSRCYYNECIIDDPNFKCDFQFMDGTTIDDYLLPGKEDRVIEYTDQMLRDCPPDHPEEIYTKPCPKSKKSKMGSVVVASSSSKFILILNQADFLLH